MEHGRGMEMLTLSRSNLVCYSRVVISILIGDKKNLAGVPTTRSILTIQRLLSVFDATLSSRMVGYSFWEIPRIN
jgi:hypothetical protein